MKHFFRCFQAESLKLRRSVIWLAFLALPLIPAIMGTFNFLNNQSILQNQWYSLWSQHTLFMAYFFLPAILGVYASYLMGLEHHGTNWNNVLTAPVPAAALYAAKLMMIMILSALTLLWIGALFFISGKLAGIKAPFPPEILGWLMFGFIGALTLDAVHLFLSLLFRSFAVPVGIALMGGIVGLFATLKGLALFFPYSLLAIGLNANNPTLVVRLSERGSFLLSAGLYIVMFSLLTVQRLNNRDMG